MNNRLFKKTDFVFIGILLLVAVALMAFMYGGKTASVANIYKGNNLIKTVDLSVDTDFSLDEFDFCVRSGAISVVHSPCKNKICVSTGAVSKGGQAIVCLPERMVVTLVSEDGYDAVVG